MMTFEITDKQFVLLRRMVGDWIYMGANGVFDCGDKESVLADAREVEKVIESIHPSPYTQPSD